MSETMLEDLLRQGDALVMQALSVTKARCAVLAQYIHDCESNGSRTAAWSDAVRELRALHDYQAGLMHRHSLIQQAIEYPVGECPTAVPLPPPPKRATGRTQQRVQLRVRRRS